MGLLPASSLSPIKGEGIIKSPPQSFFHPQLISFNQLGIYPFHYYYVGGNENSSYNRDGSLGFSNVNVDKVNTKKLGMLKSVSLKSLKKCSK